MAAGVEGEWGAAWGGVFEVRFEVETRWLERGRGLGAFLVMPAAKRIGRSACATERRAVRQGD